MKKLIFLIALIIIGLGITFKILSYPSNWAVVLAILNISLFIYLTIKTIKK